MNYSISMIPYANMAPYAALGPPADCYFVSCTPRNSIAALKEGSIWAAAVPVGGLRTLEGRVEPIGSYGIAALREVMSVLFFSDRPFDAFKGRLQVRLTDESASSVRLLYLLLGRTHGFDQMPETVPPGASANGELVIGDTALQWHHAWETGGTVKGYPYMIDLAEQWYRFCRLPVVFARWVVRTDAPEGLRRSLLDWLAAFGRREPELIVQSAPRVADRLNLPEVYVQRYLKIIRRCLTAQDHEGQHRFHQEWDRLVAAGPVAWFQDDHPSATHRTHAHG